MLLVLVVLSTEQDAVNACSTPVLVEPEPEEELEQLELECEDEEQQ